MKKTLKVFITISLAIALFLTPAIAAYAAEAESAEGMDNLQEVDENLFSRLFDEISSYATEIFCALTLVGSLILAYAYKKGLLPLVEKALLSISNAVTKIKEKTESGEIAARNLGTELNEKLNDTKDVILTLHERIKEMNDALLVVKEKETSKEKSNKNLALIVSAQVDMLYEIFMSSALPQYQKDAVGERVLKMKEALRGDVSE